MNISIELNLALTKENAFQLQVDYKLKLSKEQLCAEVKVFYFNSSDNL